MIIALKPRLFKNSGLMLWRTGWTTGIKAGVSRTPCGVCNLAMRAARSVCLTSNVTGDRDNAFEETNSKNI